MNQVKRITDTMVSIVLPFYAFLHKNNEQNYDLTRYLLGIKEKERKMQNFVVGDNKTQLKG